MHSLRFSLMTLATVISMAIPALASAHSVNDNRSMEGNGFMMTPVSLMGRFVFVNRVSRRTLRQAVAEQQSTRASVPLIRAIL